MNYLNVESDKINIKKVYSFFLVFSFILNGYSSGFPGISLGALILGVFAFLSILYLLAYKSVRFGKNGVFFSPLFIVILMVIQSLAIMLTLTNGEFKLSNMIIAFTKLALWGISISITNYLFLDYKCVYKWITIISFVSTIYLVFQNIFWYGLGYRLPSILNLLLLKPYHESYLYEVGYINYTYSFFRPSSFFSEPAYYSNIALCAIAMILFNENNKLTKKEKIMSIFLSLGIILATSTSGIYLLIILWIYYYIKNAKFKPCMLVFLISAMILTVIGFFMNELQFQSTDFGMFGDTIQYTIEKPFNFLNSARIGRSYSYLDKVEGLYQIFGIGLGNIGAYIGESDIYMNSFTILLFQHGYIGLLMFSFLLYKLVIGKKDKLSFILLVFYFLKIFSSGIMFNMFGILYLSIIIYRKKYSNLLQPKNIV